MPYFPLLKDNMRLWYSCLIVYFVNFDTIVSPLSCPPSGPIWISRAERFCSTIQKYHCLYNVIRSSETQDIYVEECINPKKYKGVRHVYSGNLDAIPCPENRYSPYPSWSYQSSVCPLAKSTCNEEEQIAVDKGTASSDRSCRCNYGDGYWFVIKPKDPCRCNPVMEDCSCYIQECRRNESLPKDYDCKIDGVKHLLKCDDIQIRRENETDPGLHDTSEENLSTYTRVGVKKEKPFFVVLVLVILMLFLSLVAGVVRSSFIDFIRHICRDYPPLIQSDDIESTTGREVSDLDECCCPNQLSESSKAESETNLEIPEKIFWKDMPVVWYYQPTKQLGEIKEAFEGENRKKLVILNGLYGSGKTQAAHRYCETAKTKYSIVDKISYGKGVSFRDVTKVHLGKNVEYRISDETALTNKSVIANVKECLNHNERQGYPYLLFIDNVDVNSKTYYRDIANLVTLKEDVPNLDIILATTDETFTTYFDKNEYSLVEFRGMQEDEYIPLFKDIRATKEDIDKLVQHTGTIPLVLATVVHYIKTSKKDMKTYLDDFCTENSTLFQSINDYSKGKSEQIYDGGYQMSVLASQKPPLQYLKEIMLKRGSNDIWEVITMLPFLCFGSISSTALEAIFHHLRKGPRQNKKMEIDFLVQTLTEVSLCHIEQTSNARMRSVNPKENCMSGDKCGRSDEKRGRILSFHNVTMKALELLEEIEAINRKKILMFLLKLFCYEIDLDARTDVTFNRNMLFVSHAMKLLHLLESESKDFFTNEMNFYLSYIHCGIGSTFLFKRSKVSDTHRHLMIARRICLSIVNESTCFKADMCPYQGLPAIGQKNQKMSEVTNPQKQVKSVFDSLLEHSFSDEFVSNFFLGKRRNLNDIHLIEVEGSDLKLDVSLNHYFSEGDLEELQKNDLALPLSTVNQNLLIELIIKILLNNGRAANELMYTILDKKSSTYIRLQDVCRVEIEIAQKYCCLLKEKMRDTEIFGVLKCDVNGRMLLRWNQDKIEHLDEDILFFNDILDNSDIPKKYFDFGLVKITEKTNFRHTAFCRRSLLKCLMRKYEESSKDEEINPDCKTVVNALLDQLRTIENDNETYTWLFLPMLYVQCGKCLLLGNEHDIKKAGECFDKAINMETSRGEFLTHYTLDGYKGKIDFLRKQNKIEDALRETNHIIGLLSNKNLDDTMKPFEKIKQSLENSRSLDL